MKRSLTEIMDQPDGPVHHAKDVGITTQEIGPLVF